MSSSRHDTYNNSLLISQYTIQPFISDVHLLWDKEEDCSGMKNVNNLKNNNVKVIYETGNSFFIRNVMDKA